MLFNFTLGSLAISSPFLTHVAMSGNSQRRSCRFNQIHTLNACFTNSVTLIELDKCK